MGLTDIIATIIILFTLIMKDTRAFMPLQIFSVSLIHSNEVLAENKFLKNTTEK